MFKLQAWGVSCMLQKDCLGLLVRMRTSRTPNRLQSQRRTPRLAGRPATAFAKHQKLQFAARTRTLPS